MDAQSDSCEPPPCDPQPPGKIRKALKLFSKRKPGGGVANIFSVRVKGEDGLKSPPSRSKTLDGLTETVASQAEAEAEAVDLDLEDSHKEDAVMDEPTNMKNNVESAATRQSISSLTSAKSLSFLSMLRWNRKGGGEEREVQTESHRSVQQRKGLKNLFGSMRWHRKDKEEADEVLPGPPLLASRSNSVEIMKENLTLTPRPARHFSDESELEQPHSSHDDHITTEDTSKVSGAAKPSTNNRLSTLLGDISTILSLESLADGGDIVADVEAEWVKVSSRVEVEAGTIESLKKEKALLALKPTLSAAPTISSTYSTITSSTTEIISSFTPPKSMHSPTAKQTLSPPSTPITNTGNEPILSHISPPTFSPTTKPVPPPAFNPDFSQTPSPVPTTIPKSPPTTPSLSIPTKPTLTPSPLTPEPSPKTSPTLLPAPSLATIPTTLISVTEKALQPDTASAIISQSSHSLCTTAKPVVLPAALTPITRPIHPMSQDTKHSSASVNKYPPFITSTKPAPSAPVIRPKIVTTFGLSTSRNTAPIIKPEPKQSVHQIKSGPFQSQTEKNGTGSAVLKTSPEEPGPAHVVKHMFAAGIQPIPLNSSPTSENPPHKPELAYTSPPSWSSLPPNLPTRSVPNIAPCYVPRGADQEDVASQRMVEVPKFASSYKPEKNTLVMKPTTVSKIPVTGGGKSKQHHKDDQANGEERQWNLPLFHEEEALISLSQETTSRETLSDHTTVSEAISPVPSYSNEDILESTARTPEGAVSIPRKSKIPIKPGSTASYHSLQEKTEVPRSKIPVSKVPVRTSNKTGPTSTAPSTRK